MIGRKHIDYEQALKKAQQYCAREEKCTIQVRQKLTAWGADQNDSEQILEQLIQDNYINEERFAREYSVGKFRNNKWGKVKIANELYRFHIREDFVELALQEIDRLDYEALLKKLMLTRLNSLKGLDQKTAIHKIVIFAIGKGFEAELVWRVARELAVGSWQ
jgi:regulatory protein